MILTPLATLIVPFFGVKPDPALGFLQRRQQQRFEFLIYVPQGSVMSQERFLDLLQPRLQGRVGEQLGAHFHEGPHYPSATLRAGSRAIATARSLLSIIAAMDCTMLGKDRRQVLAVSAACAFKITICDLRECHSPLVS